MAWLSGQNILQIWDQNRTKNTVERSLVLLRAADPDAVLEDLVSLTVGQRDEKLARFRENLFGSNLEGTGTCQACSERFSFSVDTKLIIPKYRQNESRIGKLQLKEGKWNLIFRLPLLGDLLKLSNTDDREEMALKLVESCLIEAKYSGRARKNKTLPDKIKNLVGDAMLRKEPRLEVVLNLECPSCNESAQIFFDIGSFIWAEISSLARRLMTEVSVLAKEFGWGEQQILDLTPSRRQYYLSTAGS